MNEKLALAVFSITTVALFALGVCYGIFVWDGCREAGHSGLYCLRMVMR